MLLPLQEIEHEWIDIAEIFLCSFLIGTFGIAHGAIDNHLYGFKNAAENYKFIIIYVLVAILFALVWYIQSDTAFSIFLLISAYHFGQSQFADFANKVRLIDRLFFISWGSSLLFAFLYFNQSSLTQSYLTGQMDVNALKFLIDYALYGLIVSSALLVLFFSVYLYLKQLSIQRLLIELYQLFIISVVFFLASPLLGFTMYFVILHAVRVLFHEFNFLNEKNSSFSIFKFFKLLLPFTILSIAGLGVFAALISYFELSISIPFLAIIFISCLTVPHSLVMDLFYLRGRQNVDRSV